MKIILKTIIGSIFAMCLIISSIPYDAFISFSWVGTCLAIGLGYAISKENRITIDKLEKRIEELEKKFE